MKVGLPRDFRRRGGCADGQRPARGLGLALACAFLLGIAGCASAPRVAPPPLRVSAVDPAAADPKRAAENLRIFDAAWNTINRSYYDPEFNGVDWAAAATEFGPRAAAAADEDALYVVLNTMLRRLQDNHTGATPPARARDQRRQQMTGIGVRFAAVGGQALITEVVPGGAAHEAGIQPGWIWLTRDGLPPGQAKPLTLGQKTTLVCQDLAGQRVELTLTARALGTRRREARTLREGVAYIQFNEFDLDTTSWLRARIGEMRDAPALILDLRQNGGGIVASALYAIGHFLDESQIVLVAIDRHEQRARQTPFKPGAATYRGKLAILVDGGSGSASEVLAAAIQEQARGIVVGQKTAGAVLGATRAPLPDGGELQFSETDLLTARGRRLEQTGVTPDIDVLRPTAADLRAGRDRVLERALEELTKS